MAVAKTRPLPPCPTNFLPGSEAKVIELTARHRAGFQLWHPLDAGLPEDEARQCPEDKRAAMLDALERYLTPCP